MFYKIRRLKKVIFVLFFLSILLLSNVVAEVQTLGTFKQGNCIELIQTCSNCSYINITSLISPNSTEILSNVVMTKIGTVFNRTFCNTITSGNYIVNGVGDADGVDTIWTYDFIITPLGKILTNPQAILYFIVFFIAIIFFLLCLVSAIYSPKENKRNKMSGYIIAVENLKYLRYFLFALSYLFLILMFYFGWLISYGYLDLDFLGSLFNFGFYALILALIPLFIFSVFLIIANLIHDSKVSDALQRGLKIRE